MQMKFKQGKAHDLNPKEMLLAKNYRFFVQTNAKNKYDIMEWIYYFFITIIIIITIINNNQKY